jgi:hypothetical protein
MHMDVPEPAITLDADWRCGQRENCSNLAEPGHHKGPAGYQDAQQCLAAQALTRTPLRLLTFPPKES